MPYYSFVLLCYNNWELTNQAITTLNDSISDTYKQKGIEIIVVNNGSIDDTKKYLEQIKNTFSQQIELILIHLKENMGYSVGINTGLAQCKGEIITVLNNDLIFPKHWFDGIVNTLESDKSIGAAVPFLSHADMQQYEGVEFENISSDINRAVTLACFLTRNPNKFGMVDFNGNQVLEIIDKPTKSILKWMWGAMAWGPEFTNELRNFVDHYKKQGKTDDQHINKKGEFILSNTLTHLIHELKVFCHLFKNGVYIDLGTYGEIRDWFNNGPFSGSV